MVRPAVSDTSAALLAFSKSFKKVRRAGTTHEAGSGRRRKKKEQRQRIVKPRSTSLPNLKDLYVVVRDNAKQLESDSTDSAAEALALLQDKRHQCRSKWVSLSSPALAEVPSTVIPSDRYYLRSYLHPNGPGCIAKGSVTVQKNPSVFVPKATLYDVVKQTQDVSHFSSWRCYIWISYVIFEYLAWVCDWVITWSCITSTILMSALSMLSNTIVEYELVLNFNSVKFIEIPVELVYLLSLAKIQSTCF